MTTNLLAHRVDRVLMIQAPPEIVFGFFTDNERWAAWWGAGSTIDPTPGGEVRILMPGGVEVRGEVLEIAAPVRLVFTYGFTSGTPIPVGASRVQIELEESNGATRLQLFHDFDEPAVRDEHVQGWRYQMSLFSNLVANRLHAGAAQTVDQWFAAWSEPDGATREAALDRIAASNVQFSDQFSAVAGLDDLKPHLAAVHTFMPGMRIMRDGEVRHCQGRVLADWVARGADGNERARGTNVFALFGDGRVASVVGFWNRPAAGTRG
jgi:uncharacterized protein YndB with AHSA1/START domain